MCAKIEIYGAKLEIYGAKLEMTLPSAKSYIWAIKDLRLKTTISRQPPSPLHPDKAIQSHSNNN